VTEPAAFDGLSERQLAELLGCPLVRIHASVPSTLDVAHELGAAGAPHGTLVIADTQTAGRGRLGRAWSSPTGGLWMTLLVRPARAPLGGALAVRAGLAARAAVGRAAPEAAPRLKWPNDVIVTDLKAGGVLCEACWTGQELGWIAIGVGINVRGPVPLEVRERAVALADVAPHVTRIGVLEHLVPRLVAAADGSAGLTAAEKAEFLAGCWMPPGDATPEGLADDGTLLLRHADGALERRVAPA